MKQALMDPEPSFGEFRPVEVNLVQKFMKIKKEMYSEAWSQVSECCRIIN